MLVMSGVPVSCTLSGGFAQSASRRPQGGGLSPWGLLLDASKEAGHDEIGRSANRADAV